MQITRWSITLAAAALTALAHASMTAPTVALHGVDDPPARAPAPPADTTPRDNEADTIVAAALERIGGARWAAMKSLESVATARTAMGEATITYRFVAPDARLLVQTLPGGRGTVEMGVVGGTAWMGEPGRVRAIDPALAAEMSGGGDLQSLVHELDRRFEAFRLEGRAILLERDAHRITMLPKRDAAATAPRAESERWTLWIDAANTTILGLDIPAPPESVGANAPVAGTQTIRFGEWRAVDVPEGVDAGRMLAFGTAIIEAGGLKTELVVKRVAVDTLAPGSIAPPASIGPAPATPAVAR
jgi:hypothetical protein